MFAGLWFGSYSCICKVKAWKGMSKQVGTLRRTKRGCTPELDGTGEPTSHHQTLSRSLQTRCDSIGEMHGKHTATTVPR